MIKEEFWNKDLKLFEIPKFQCPNCEIGLLIPKEEKLINAFTKKSKDYYDVIGDAECYEGFFMAISLCNNPECEEIITIAGETKILEVGMETINPEPFEDYDEPHPIYKTSYTITYINPAIKFIKFPKNTPKEIIAIIEESFKLFWVDEDSCANKIRNSIEKLLDLQKVRKSIINRKQKRQLLTLHGRIEEFKKKKPEIIEYLFAIKWIGNQGSHNEKFKLSRKELIDAYRILELIIIDLYDKSRNELDKLTKKINKEKKHRLN